jgi:hypothetical protein
VTFELIKGNITKILIFSYNLAHTLRFNFVQKTLKSTRFVLYCFKMLKVEVYELTYVVGHSYVATCGSLYRSVYLLVVGAIGLCNIHY